ncbi:SOS response-associated peptidase [Neobacillus notoginsengisoli]|uniref:Abasic site processing protein n=1 Tax=Neobacillus notoginsengisoli TaxID=1578198 RepID=A0A417YZH3_9BACI|nr:SOS response-associated peptidase [Neobacillus notoginsengisoli]RHW43154.1 SOS response-associated peptidase [Neobacillus notoginsengisoli]
MCGRFSLITDVYELMRQFQFEFDGELEPRYNIAPGTDILAIAAHGDKRVAGMLRWGLIPFWADNEKIGYKMINARAETVHEKGSFKQPLKSKRCLIPADGYFEWKREGNVKQPYRFINQDNRPLAFAGLFDRWDRGGKTIYSCTIITTAANEKTAAIHDRMPAILEREQQDIWLDPSVTDPLTLTSLLKPYPLGKIDFYQVSTRVNSARNEDEELIAPLNSK